jgi:hypothetical protein
MQRRIFWALFLTSSVILDVTLPLVASLILALPLAVACWWIAYRSGWFE